VNRPRNDVTDAELAILEVLWDRGPSTIREVARRLYPEGGASGYANVQKLLDRLQDKEAVTRRPRGRANEFLAAIGRDDLVERRLQETADRLCGGSLTPLLTHLVTSTALSAQEIAALRHLVEQLARRPDEEEAP